QLLHFVTVRRYVIVADGPVFTPALLHALSLEIKWTESVAAASPKVCATADGAQARPGKLSSRCEGVRVFFRDCVQVVRPLLDFPLHALRQFAVFAWFALAAVRPLVGKLV